MTEKSEEKKIQDSDTVVVTEAQRERNGEEFLDMLRRWDIIHKFIMPLPPNSSTYDFIQKMKINVEKLRCDYEKLKQLLKEMKLQIDSEDDLIFIAEIQKGGRVAIPKSFRIYHHLKDGDLVTMTVKRKQANA